MNRVMYSYSFNCDIPLKDVEESLLISVMAAESLYGRTKVQLDASFRLDPLKRSCLVDAETEVGSAITRIFTGFLSREFGENSFKVERLGNTTSKLKTTTTE